MQINPGEIYWLLDEGGQRDRPIIIVSREKLNRGDYVVAIPTTTRKFDRRSKLSSCVPFKAGECGFDHDCVAQAEMIGVYEKWELDLRGGIIATLDTHKMRDVQKAIGYVIAAELEPEEDSGAQS